MIARADQSGVVWGAGLISAEMKDLPPLAPFDEFVLSTTELKEKEQSRITVDFIGSDPKAVTASIDQMKQQVQEGIAEMEQQGVPALEPMLKIMKGVKFYSMGLNGSISATVDGGPANLIGLLLTRVAGGGP